MNNQPNLNNMQDLINYASQINPIYGQAVNQENAYSQSMIDQLNAQHQTQLDQLNAQQGLSFGSNPSQESASFLQSVANPTEAAEGQIPYDYNLDTSRENQGYGYTTQGLDQSHQLALAKLANDEQATLQNNAFAQKTANQQGLENLNSRGLISGQTYNQAGGIAGLQRQQTNQPFLNTANQTQTAYNTNVGGEDQNYDLTAQQNAFTHQNALADITTNARRSGENQLNTYNFGTQSANNDYNAQMNALQRQKAQNIYSDYAGAQQAQQRASGVGYG